MAHDPGQPSRKQLPHDVPIWIDPAAEVYFITVNCQTRGVNSLCRDEVAAFILDSVSFRNRSREWFCHLCLLMPDHLHMLVSFTNRTKTIQQTIGDWKRWLAVKMGIEWQTNFFEHRLRNDQEVAETAHYVLQNPVRQGLVNRAEDWKHVWRPQSADER